MSHSFIYDGSNLVGEYNQTTSTWDTEYTYGYAMVDKQGVGGTEFQFYDGLGDVYQSLNASGSYVLSGEVSDDFGQHFGSSGTLGTDDLAYKWRASSGYRWDNDGLWAGDHNEPIVEVEARYYIPAMGVFITRNTDLGEQPYEYCDDDPVNFVDPTGYGPTREGWYWIGGGLIGGGLFSDVAGYGIALAVTAGVITAPGWLVPTLVIGGFVAIAAGTAAWLYGGDPAPGAPWFTGKPVFHPTGYAFTGSDPAPGVFIAKGGAPATFGYYYGSDAPPTWTPTPSKPSRSDY